MTEKYDFSWAGQPAVPQAYTFGPEATLGHREPESFSQLIEQHPGLPARHVAGLREITAETTARINEGNFSDFDRRIAHGVVAEILRNELQYAPEPDYDASYIRPAMDAVQRLVPTKKDGKRTIDGKPIADAIERRIASRLESSEIDMGAPEGSWGRLPEAVKRYIAAYPTGVSFELTTNCTASCSFCALANKGPVEGKASFESVEVVMDYLTSHTNPALRGTFVDWFYYGTDPFDAKWQGQPATADTATVPERDYTDLAIAHHNRWAGAAGTYRELFTSTVVPLGEEFRVLRFLDAQKRGIVTRGVFRMSVTPASAHRISHLQTISTALGYTAHSNDLRPMEKIARRGSAWKSPTQPTAWDIIGPDCKDGLVLNPAAIDAVVMYGASQDNPDGSIRWPIEEQVEDGIEYTLPRPMFSPVAYTTTTLADFSPAELCPDITLDILHCGHEGELVRQWDISYPEDANRALLRLAHALNYLKETKERYVFDPVLEQRCQAIFDVHFLHSLRLLQERLTLGPNEAMSSIVQAFREQGYID